MMAQIIICILRLRDGIWILKTPCSSSEKKDVETVFPLGDFTMWNEV